MSVIHDKESIINQMYGYLDDEQRKNINKESFNDIANVFIDFYSEYIKQYEAYKNNQRRDKVKWVCNASMGHGKSIVLECFLKWLINENRPLSRVPVLVAIRENKEAKKLENSLNEFKVNSCLQIDDDNREKMEPVAKFYQILIISHSRMDNLALKIGNQQNYKVWHQPSLFLNVEDDIKEGNIICKRQRLLIIDEKPTFVNSALFDIGSENNSLDWFDNLAKKEDADAFEIQAIRHYINMLVSEQLSKNPTSITTRLIDKDELKTDRAKKLMSYIRYAERNVGVIGINNLKTVKLLKKLIHHDGAGRIDDYSHNSKLGRRIIVAERIKYGKLGLNILVLDGTCEANKLQYHKEFTLKRVKNYNNYSRLFLHQDVINTSREGRQRENKSTQETISNRIKKLREKHPNLFVLPLKEDVNFYLKSGAILDEHRKYFEETKESKMIHLLNTTGKNYLKDFSELYLTSLPRFNPEHYKAVAISLYGHNVSLKMNHEKGSLFWFEDTNLEMVYRGMLYAEILQIIHRSSLRIIRPEKLNQEVHIYIAFDDSKKDRALLHFQPLMFELNTNYLYKKAKYDFVKLQDMSLYGREDTIRKWAEEVDTWIQRNHSAFRPFTQMLIGQLGNSDDGKERLGLRFREWLKKQWSHKKDEINRIFNEYGYTIFEDEYKGKPAKFIVWTDYYYAKQVDG